MNIASIDTGTNTVLLLIASTDSGKNLKVVKEIHNMPRMGEDVFKSGVIKEEKIIELCNIYSYFRKECDANNVTKIIACGTNVFRIAKNSDEVIRRVYEASGIELTIISGDLEADCSYLGATADFDRNERIAVIDIGGGSSEVTCKEGNNLIFQKSFSTGVVTLRENFLREGMVTAENTKRLEQFCDDFFDELTNIEPLPSKAISIAGTPTTLFSLYKKYPEFYGEKIHKQYLSIENIDEVLKRTHNIPFSDYGKFGKIVKGREDLLAAGAMVLKTILKKTGLAGTFVSITGLRYGIILKYLLSPDDWSGTAS